MLHSLEDETIFFVCKSLDKSSVDPGGSPRVGLIETMASPKNCRTSFIKVIYLNVLSRFKMFLMFIVIKKKKTEQKLLKYFNFSDNMPSLWMVPIPKPFFNVVPLFFKIIPLSALYNKIGGGVCTLLVQETQIL